MDEFEHGPSKYQVLYETAETLLKIARGLLRENAKLKRKLKAAERKSDGR